MRRPLALGALVVSLGLSACGGSDGGDGTALVSTAATAAPAATVAAAAPAPTTTPLPGETFTDPEGDYTLLISPDWAEAFQLSPTKGIEVWKVAPVVDGFGANVNVLTQPAGGKDLQGYLDANEKAMGSMTVIDVRTVDAGGTELGVFEYSGTPPGADRDLHFLSVISVADGTAVLATLTATEDAFTTLRPTVERYLLTLRRT